MSRNRTGITHFRWVKPQNFLNLSEFLTPRCGLSSRGAAGLLLPPGRGQDRLETGDVSAVIANVLIAVVAAIHAYIVILEMVLWEKPAGRRAFGLTPEFAAQSRVLAANQGLYNAFLAAGLVYGLVRGDAGYEFKLFFLACVLLAGLFGAATASRRILFVQALPATLALVALWAGV